MDAAVQFADLLAQSVGSRVAGASGVASMRAELAGELLEAHRAATSRIR